MSDDITAQILELNGGVTKTKIMYKAFLSYAQKEYLAVLIENGY